MAINCIPDTPYQKEAAEMGYTLSHPTQSVGPFQQPEKYGPFPR